MIRPAVLFVQPKHLDYPVWRYNLERFRDYFDSVWIALSDHWVEGQDLSNFVRAKLQWCNFLEFKRSRDDWRDDAINALLDKVDTEYVLFMEQDFLIKDNAFFEKVFVKPHDFIYYKEDQRIHPSFALVKRSVVDKTSRDFSAQPPGDHFYNFFNELPPGINIEELGVKNKEDYVHMAGTSQNYRNFEYGDPFYHPNNFLYFNWLNLQFPDQHPGFYQVQLALERVYGHPASHVYLKKFFPKEFSEEK